MKRVVICGGTKCGILTRANTAYRVQVEVAVPSLKSKVIGGKYFDVLTVCPACAKAAGYKVKEAAGRKEKEGV